MIVYCRKLVRQKYCILLVLDRWNVQESALKYKLRPWRERERERAFGLYYFFDGMVYTTVVDGIIRYDRICVIIIPNHKERENFRVTLNSFVCWNASFVFRDSTFVTHSLTQWAYFCSSFGSPLSVVSSFVEGGVG